MRKNKVLLLFLVFMAFFTVFLSGCSEDTIKAMLEKYGVVVEGGGFDEGCTLIPNVVNPNSEEGAQILEKIETINYDKTEEVYIFDIYVMNDGVKVQPNGIVTVTLPLPDSSITNCLVLHITNDNKVELLKSSIESGLITFETSSFSYFVLAQESDSPDGECTHEYEYNSKEELQAAFLADWAEWAAANGVEKIDGEYGLFTFFNNIDGNYFKDPAFLAEWGWLAQYVCVNTNSGGNQGAVKSVLDGKTGWYNYRRAAAEFVLFFAELSGADYRAQLTQAEADSLAASGASYILGEGSTSFADPAIAAGWKSSMKCIKCGYIEVNEELKFILNEDGMSYSVAGIGTCTDLDVIIPSTYNDLSVTRIGDYAFYDCEKLTSIEIPNSVTSIGEHAFSNCTSLTSITIPNSVTNIGIQAFYGCSSLTSITIPNSVTSIGSFAFHHCTSLTSIVVDVNNSVYDSRNNCNAIIETSTNELILGCKNTTIPDSVTSIGDWAFYYCRSLTSITIPNSVTSIGIYAFEYCTSLTSVTIPNSVTSIGDWAFRVCTSLTSIEIPNSVTSIGDYAFWGCTSLTSVKFEENSQLTSIGSSAFRGCTGLTSITIPNSVTRIGDWAFRDCTSLTSVKFEENSQLTSIGYGAFYRCTSLTSVKFEENSQLTSIGENAFRGCTSLTSIEIPNSVTSIGDDAFYSCTSLTSIVVDVNNSVYDSRNNCNAIIETSTNELIVGCKNTTIPDSVTSIGTGAFYGCTSLTSIEIPNSVTSIGNSAFSGCTSLTSITIPNSVTSIGDYAFWGCTSLTSITIPNSVTNIGEYAFVNCNNLTILCEIDEKPAEWNSLWNSSNRPVIWGYCNHNLEHYNYVEATCEEHGNKEYWHCVKCDKYFLDIECNSEITEEETNISSLGHKYETVITNPTCTEEGYTLHTCTVCGNTYKDTYVKALGHDETDWIIDENPTCKKEGTKHTECERCKETIQTASIPTIDHNYVNNKCTMCGKEKEQSQVSLVPYEENGKTYINFGRYPQTVVTDKNLINELDKITTTNSLGYIEYNGEEYKKQVAYPVYSDYTFKNGNTIQDGATYYFKVEPIKWRVLETANGSYKLLSEYLLNTQQFYTSTLNRTLNGKTIYANNYEYSTIRAWLNGYNGTSYGVEDYTNKGFIDIAFTEEEQAIIKTTLVDNSSESTGYKENQYVCNNTYDKIYLLSLKEATNTTYGFDSDYSEFDPERRAQVTDYALARYCVMNSNRVGERWLRSPDSSSSYNARDVRTIGYIYITSVNRLDYGVRAALEINLTNNPHNHNYTTKVVNPTCEEQGYTLHTCSVCKDTYKDTYVDALGHDETDWIIDEDPTCKKEGTKHTECERCKETIQTASTPKIDHNYVNNKCTMCGKEPIQVSLKPYEENGKTYINFGRYPQTVITDENLIKELDKITTTNSLGYIEYNGEEYKKQVADPRGSDPIFQNGNEVVDGATYYFLVEPIKWRVLETANGSYKLLSEYLLDTQEFHTSWEDRTLNGETIYQNNYEYSSTRAWLNGYNGTSYGVEDYTNKGFIDIAFTEEEKAIIKTTLVDNSASSTGYSTNQYACNNTNDKIYLLSVEEATNTKYGFSSSTPYDSSRESQPTDYAISRRVIHNDRNGYWWLRSPNGDNSYSAHFVYYNGSIGNYDCSKDDFLGVRAALEINLTNNPHNHNYTTKVINPTCEEEGYTLHTCTVCGNTYKDTYVEALGHELTHHDKLSATCEEKGHEAYDECSRCDYTTYKEIPALGHDIIKHDGKEATYDSEGYKDYETCSRCDYSTFEKIPMLEPETPSEQVDDIFNSIANIFDTTKNIIEMTYKSFAGIIDVIIDSGNAIGKAFEKIAKIVEKIMGILESPSSPDYNEPTDEPTDEPTKPSEGLRFILNEDGMSYSVAGIGTCTDLDVIIPSTYNNLPVTIIRSDAFKSCTSLTSIEIPNSVTSIEVLAFSHCTSLINIDIPANVTYIGDGVFLRCLSLEEINVDCANEHYKSIDGNLYSKDNKILIQYAIGKKDAKFSVSNDVTTINRRAFEDCTSLTSIEIPNSVTSIGEYAFTNCTSLTSIEIPNSVTSIGEYAFTNCTSLINIDIPANVTYIGEGVFSRCSSLEEINVDCANEHYKSIDGNLYSKDNKILIQYAIGKKDAKFSVSNDVTTINRSAFQDCTSLTSIEIPNSVTSIGFLAFQNCINLWIYCEVKSQPSGWDAHWNLNNRPVVWGYLTQESLEIDFNNAHNIVSNDLLVDLSAYYGTAITLEEFHNISETASVTMYDFFLTHETYSVKWGWLSDFFIETRGKDDDQSSGVSYLNEKNNTYWRYEVWAFLNKDTRESWPYSSEYDHPVVQAEFVSVYEETLSN